MKFTHNFKNVNWWVLLPARGGRIDSFLPGYSSRICRLEQSVAGTAHPDPASSKNTSDSSSGNAATAE